MRQFRVIVVAVALALSACSGPRTATMPRPASAGSPAAWAGLRHVPGVIDLAGPRTDGSFLVAAGRRLFVLGRDGALSPFARGAGGYVAAAGDEPYLVIADGDAARGGHCAFGRDAAFAIAPGRHPAIIIISPQGQARQFASLPPGSAPSGIAFDATGRFGHRLLVTARRGGGTTVLGIGCDGRTSTVAAGIPPVEGGMAVAPATFGEFGGDLIAPDENSGLVYAVAPSGKVAILARSGLSAGRDIGVESAGFAPAAAAAAYLADRFAPGNSHPGDDVILRIPAAALARAGIQPGDLLVATEGGAKTIDVRCAATCVVRYVAGGPAIAHAEGHIVFAPS